jgi:hypothetical protein
MRRRGGGSGGHVAREAELGRNRTTHAGEESKEGVRMAGGTGRQVGPLGSGRGVNGR